MIESNSTNKNPFSILLQSISNTIPIVLPTPILLLPISIYTMTRPNMTLHTMQSSQFSPSFQQTLYNQQLFKFKQQTISHFYRNWMKQSLQSSLLLSCISTYHQVMKLNNPPENILDSMKQVSLATGLTSLGYYISTGHFYSTLRIIPFHSTIYIILYNLIGK